MYDFKYQFITCFLVCKASQFTQTCAIAGKQKPTGLLPASLPGFAQPVQHAGDDDDEGGDDDDVDDDDDDSSSQCKTKRFTRRRSVGQCSSCPLLVGSMI